MHNIKLVALDVDGTLWDYENRLHEKVEKALTAVCATKVVPVIVSGWTRSQVQHIMALWPKIRYYILANGAYIYDAAEERVLYREGLAAGVLRRIADHAGSDTLLELYADGTVLVEEEAWTKIAQSGAPLPENLKPQGFTANLREIIKKRREDADMLRLHFQNAAACLRLLQLCEGWKVTATLVSRTVLEVSAAEASKGKALCALCENLGVEGRAVLAMGDGQSDISMLKFAGLPVAPVNADDEVKTFASVIAPSCMDGGVAWVLQRYILNV